MAWVCVYACVCMAIRGHGDRGTDASQALDEEAAIDRRTISWAATAEPTTAARATCKHPAIIPLRTANVSLRGNALPKRMRVWPCHAMLWCGEGGKPRPGSTLPVRQSAGTRTAPR
jgi:hypothetical protein